MSNVIEFPIKDKVNASAKTREELQQTIVDYKEEIAEEASEYLWRNLLGEMSRMGCDFDKEINAGKRGKKILLTKPDSKVKVMVVPTNEELVIAQDTERIIQEMNK